MGNIQSGYEFATPTGLRKVVTRVLVVCSFFYLKYLSSSFTNTSFVDFWPIYFAFGGSAFIEISNNTWGQVSISMNDYPLNAKYTGRQSTKEVLVNELEIYFR